MPEPFAFLRSFFVTAVALIICCCVAGYMVGPIDGDLTRLGPWSERNFAPTKLQPVVPILRNKSSVPDILLLGDSFSMGNVWQSMVEEATGLTTLSFHYDGSGCIRNWLDWVSGQRFHGVKTVIVQTIERRFVTRFAEIRTCRTTTPQPLVPTESKPPAAPSQWPLTLDASYLAGVAWNEMQLKRTQRAIVSAGVVNAPLSTSALFSNRRSDRILYLQEDEKRSWLEVEINNAVTNIAALQDEFAAKGKKLILLIIPDKLTTYKNFLVESEAQIIYTNVFERLENRGVNYVKLLKTFRDSATQIVDFYLPNNTHLSTMGYHVLASEISRHGLRVEDQ